VVGGLMLSDRVVDSPPDSLESGDAVRISRDAASAKPPDRSDQEAHVN